MTFCQQSARFLVERVLQMTTRESWPAIRAAGWRFYGFGMLRLDLDPNFKLHIWHRKFRLPKVSAMHDHPWAFQSQVVVGTLINYRYTRTGKEKATARPYNLARIQCGAGACQVSEPETIYLVRGGGEIYAAGDKYRQNASEIHETDANDGTVTLVQRVLAPEADPDHAHVIWPDGETWGDAEVRPAEPSEVITACYSALGHFA